MAGGNNTLEGGDGNDLLKIAEGTSNVLRGGNGDDLISLISPLDLSTQTEISGGEGSDTLQLAFNGLSVTYDDVAFEHLSSIETIKLKGNAAHVLTLGEVANSVFQNGLTISMVGGGNPLTLDAHASNFSLSVNASAKDDLLLGGSAADVLTGAQGNDTLQGGLGADQLNGGAGDDTFVYHSSAEFTDDVLVGGGGGFDTLVFGPDSSSENPFMGDLLIGLEGPGKFLSIEKIILNTQTHAEISLNNLSKSTWGNRLTIDAADVDSLTLLAEESQTALNVTISHSTEGNTLFGGTRNDTLTGGAGADTVAGGAGSDTLTGGAGHDTFVWKAGHLGTDTITDFEVGVDQLDFSDLFAQLPELHVGKGTYGIYSFVQNGVTVVRADLSGYGRADLRIHFTSDIGPIDFTGTPNPQPNLIIGTPGDDNLQGSSGADLIQALAGDDTVFGGNGNDTIEGGAGNDELSGGLGDDVIDAGGGYDISVSKVVYGDEGDDRITLTGYASQAFGGTGDDYIDFAAAFYPDVRDESGNDTYLLGAGFRGSVSDQAGSDTYLVTEKTLINQVGTTNSILIDDFDAQVDPITGEPVVSGDIDMLRFDTPVSTSILFTQYDASQQSVLITLGDNVTQITAVGVDEFHFSGGLIIPFAELVGMTAQA